MSSPRTSLLFATCAMLSILLIPSLALADKQTALQRYEEAQRAYQSGDFMRAAELLEIAYAEDPDLIYQYNRIRALQADNKFAAALKVLSLYENTMTRDPEGRFNDVPEIRKKLEASIAAEAKKNDPPKGEGTKEPDGPKDIKDPKDPVKPPKAEPLNTNAILGWSLVGVGSATFAAGALVSTGIFVDGKKPFSSCSDSTKSDDGLQKCRASAASQTPIAIGLIVGGVVLGGVGTFLALTSSPKDTKKDKETSWILSPYVGPDQAGATFQLQF